MGNVENEPPSFVTQFDRWTRPLRPLTGTVSFLLPATTPIARNHP
jgi:hypothetical protein